MTDPRTPDAGKQQEGEGKSSANERRTEMREELIHMTAPKSPIHPPMSRRRPGGSVCTFCSTDRT